MKQNAFYQRLSEHEKRWVRIFLLVERVLRSFLNLEFGHVDRRTSGAIAETDHRSKDDRRTIVQILVEEKIKIKFLFFFRIFFWPRRKKTAFAPFLDFPSTMLRRPLTSTNSRSSPFSSPFLLLLSLEIDIKVDEIEDLNAAIQERKNQKPGTINRDAFGAPILPPPPSSLFSILDGATPR